MWGGRAPREGKALLLVFGPIYAFLWDGPDLDR